MVKAEVERRIRGYLGAFMDVTGYEQHDQCIEINADEGTLLATAECTGDALDVMFMADDTMFDWYEGRLRPTCSI